MPFSLLTVFVSSAALIQCFDRSLHYLGIPLDSVIICSLVLWFGIVVLKSQLKQAKSTIHLHLMICTVSCCWGFFAGVTVYPPM